MSTKVNRLGLGAILLGIPAVLLLSGQSVSAETAVKAPPPAVSVPNTAPTETAVFAGGCFWGVQGVYQHVKGVKSALSGFTGGDRYGAHYERVSEGNTGHAESVKVTFDPRVVSYADLLRIYFSVVADPTMLNAQGPDRGTQYRSALFPQSEAQAKVARAYIAQLRAENLWKRPIVTTIEPAKPFYPAEGYHQDYLTLHPDAGYIVYNDMPKLAALKQLYPNYWREKPVLVRG
jgi:peptide-methionine (S)-S-oxide reductase